MSETHQEPTAEQIAEADLLRLQSEAFLKAILPASKPNCVAVSVGMLIGLYLKGLEQPASKMQFLGIVQKVVEDSLNGKLFNQKDQI